MIAPRGGTTFPVWLIAVACCMPPVLADDLLEPLDLRSVRVGGEIGRRIDITITNNLLVLDADRDFLPAFRVRDGKTSYIGLGKLIDSAVKLAACSGDPRVLALKEHLVAETIKTQDRDGYIGVFPPDRRVTALWDVHELGYVIWGLLADHAYFGGTNSLHAARRAADWLLRNWSALPEGWGADADVAPHVAFTGLERTMLSLNRATGERSYLDFVTTTRALPAWDPGIVVGRRKGIEGHIYAYLARCLAQLELHRTQADRKLLRATERAMDFLTHHDGALITGSSGQCEIWTNDQDARGDVGETCAIAYQLRVYDALLRGGGDAALGDLMERTIFNALFASQSPDGRRLRYFAPLEGARVYWNTDTYCCPCNYRRIVAELPAMVFYRAADGVTVNLFTPATAKLTAGRDVPITITQETDYPNSGQIRIALDPARPANFALRLRIPAWATNATVSVNGRPEKSRPEPGSFFALRREWKAGDVVELDLPMSWRLVKGRQRQAGRVAVLRGPLVFCLDPVPVAALAKQDGVELGYLALNPASLGDPVRDDTVRPNGLGCRVQAWNAGFGLSTHPDHEFTLSEFPDPDGRAVYFRLRDFAPAGDDELFVPRGGR